MEAKLTFKYDREADVLHIDKCPPYAAQESEELGDDVIACLNPTTGEVENLEVLFFSTRLLPQRPLRTTGHGRPTFGGVSVSTYGTICPVQERQKLQQSAVPERRHQIDLRYYAPLQLRGRSAIRSRTHLDSISAHPGRA
jgi:uncharacterized protein YuzE